MRDDVLDLLRRRPDVEAPDLVAVDASDRLLLDLAAGHARVAVIGDAFGALTLALAADGVAVSSAQDSIVAERALAANAEAVRAAGIELAPFTIADSIADAVEGAEIVLLRLPRSLDALAAVAADVALANPAARLIGAGRIKHMSLGMNEVLARRYDRIDVSLARQKSRALLASQPMRPESDEPDWPRSVEHPDLGLTVCAHGAAFAGTTIDIGTRYLLEFLDRMKPDAANAIDLGCGTGVLAAALAQRRPGLRVLATDQSAAAVASAAATMRANGVADRVRVLRDDALSMQPDGSAELIVLNPPFHIGSSVHAGIALKLFEDAARVLRPGGELWTVWNTHLGYRPALARIVGQTHQVGRNTKFTVTVSTGR